MASGSAVALTLPMGFWHAGVAHREAHLRPVTDEDDAFLVHTAAALCPARRATELLGRCVVALGPAGTDSQAAVRTLSVGDREALLLHLRRATLGEDLHAVLGCPAPGCEATLEVELKVAELLVPPNEQVQEFYARDIAVEGVTYWVEFRLPTGEDLEAAAEVAPTDPLAGAGAIVRRCVRQACRVDTGMPSRDLPASALRALSARMVELDPQAEIELELTCPVCTTSFGAILDAGAYLLAELDARLNDLYREVHTLARHYHWSEREIRDMPATRRQRYLSLLAETLGGEERQ